MELSLLQRNFETFSQKMEFDMSHTCRTAEIKGPNGTCRIDFKEPNEERRGRQPFVTKQGECDFIQIPNEPTCAYERNSSEIVVWPKLENQNRHCQTGRTCESNTTTRSNEVVQTLLKNSPTGRTRQIIRY